jgi:hypothetical protein
MIKEKATAYCCGFMSRSQYIRCTSKQKYRKTIKLPHLNIVDRVFIKSIERITSTVIVNFLESKKGIFADFESISYKIKVKPVTRTDYIFYIKPKGVVNLATIDRIHFNIKKFLDENKNCSMHKIVKIVS